MTNHTPWHQELRAGLKPALRTMGMTLLVIAFAVAITAFAMVMLVTTALVVLGLDHDLWIGAPPTHIPAAWIVETARTGAGIILLAVTWGVIAFVRRKGRRVLEKQEMIGDTWRQEFRAGLRPALWKMGETLLMVLVAVSATAIAVLTMALIILAVIGLNHGFWIGAASTHAATWVIWGSRLGVALLVAMALGSGVSFVRRQGRKALERKTRRTA